MKYLIAILLALFTTFSVAKDQERFDPDMQYSEHLKCGDFQHIANEGIALMHEGMDLRALPLVPNTPPDVAEALTKAADALMTYAETQGDMSKWRALISKCLVKDI